MNYNGNPASVARENYYIQGQRENSLLEELVNYHDFRDLTNWTSVAGRSITNTYYGGVEAGNPSGNANIKTSEYFIDGTLVVTRTFTYNATDGIVTDIAS